VGNDKLLFFIMKEDCARKMIDKLKQTKTEQDYILKFLRANY